MRWIIGDGKHARPGEEEEEEEKKEEEEGNKITGVGVCANVLFQHELRKATLTLDLNMLCVYVKSLCVHVCVENDEYNRVGYVFA